MLLHSVNLWNLAFYALMVFMATLGLWDVFFGFEENKCSMSYMFEYPEYQVRFCPPFAGPSEARAPPALPFGAFPLPRLPAPLPSPYPYCVSAFLAPEYFAAPRGPLLLPFVSCVLGGVLDGWFPEHPPRPPRGCSQFLRPVRGPESRAEKGRARHSSSPETQLQSLPKSLLPAFLP